MSRHTLNHMFAMFMAKLESSLILTSPVVSNKNKKNYRTEAETKYEGLLRAYPLQQYLIFVLIRQIMYFSG